MSEFPTETAAFGDPPLPPLAPQMSTLFGTPMFMNMPFPAGQLSEGGAKILETIQRNTLNEMLNNSAISTSLPNYTTLSASPISLNSHSHNQEIPSTSQNGHSVPQSPSPSSSTMKGERCVGCGSDSAIRIHYGAASCHGCKAFFRRSVFEGRVYSCSANNNCDITNESRNRCRACRFRNCIDGGMNPKHVREERTKIERLSTATRSPPQHEEVDRKCSNEKNQLTNFLTALELQCEQFTDKHVPDQHIQPCKIYEQWADSSVYTTLPKSPSHVLRGPMNWKCNRLMTDDDVVNAWNKSFVLLTDWTISIPEFRNLPQADQTTLLRQSCMIFAWMHHSFKCYKSGQSEIGIPLGNGSFIPCNQSDLYAYAILARKAIDTVVKPMIYMEMEDEEYCILKALAVFQIDSDLTEAGQMAVEKMQDRLLEALTTHLEKKFILLTPSQLTQRAVKGTMLFASLAKIAQLESSFTSNLRENNLKSVSYQM